MNLLRGAAPLPTAAIVVTLLIAVASAGFPQGMCKPPQKWTIMDKDLMSESRGNITLVAFLSASCGFCVKQAFMLGMLKSAMDEQGIGFNAMIINDRTLFSMIYADELTKATRGVIPVHQETIMEPVWDVVGASRDDILVYDKCGRLALHLSPPFSNLYNPHQTVKKAIQLLHKKPEICGPCQPKPQETQMKIDAIVQDIIPASANNNPEEQIHENVLVIVNDESVDQAEQQSEKVEKRTPCKMLLEGGEAVSTECEDPVMEVQSDTDEAANFLPPPMDSEAEMEIRLQRLDDIDDTFNPENTAPAEHGTEKIPNIPEDGAGSLADIPPETFPNDNQQPNADKPPVPEIDLSSPSNPIPHQQMFTNSFLTEQPAVLNPYTFIEQRRQLQRPIMDDIINEMLWNIIVPVPHVRPWFDEDSMNHGMPGPLGPNFSPNLVQGIIHIPEPEPTPEWNINAHETHGSPSEEVKKSPWETRKLHRAHKFHKKFKPNKLHRVGLTSTLEEPSRNDLQKSKKAYRLKRIGSPKGNKLVMEESMLGVNHELSKNEASDSEESLEQQKKVRFIPKRFHHTNKWTDKSEEPFEF